MVIWEHNV